MKILEKAKIPVNQGKNAIECNCKNEGENGGENDKKRKPTQE